MAIPPRFNLLARAWRRRPHLFRVPARVERVAHADEVQQLAGHEIDDLAERRGVEVQARVARREDDAGVAEDLVVIHVDRRERHLAVREDQLPPLLQRHGGGPRDEVVADPVRDLGQRVARTGHDHHAVVQEAAAG